jgi:hypothetical protein
MSVSFSGAATFKPNESKFSILITNNNSDDYHISIEKSDLGFLKKVEFNGNPLDPVDSQKMKKWRGELDSDHLFIKANGGTIEISVPLSGDYMGSNKIF